MMTSAIDIFDALKHTMLGHDPITAAQLETSKCHILSQVIHIKKQFSHLASDGGPDNTAQDEKLRGKLRK